MYSLEVYNYTDVYICIIAYLSGNVDYYYTYIVFLQKKNYDTDLDSVWDSKFFWYFRIRFVLLLKVNIKQSNSFCNLYQL